MLATVLLGYLVLTACGTTTSTVSDAQIARAAAVGDVTAGEELFNQPLDGVPHSLSCSSCHTFTGEAARNPSMIGISAIAADRIEGLSDVEYLRQSIVDPYEFKPTGEWGSAPMPYQYPELLTDDQINDLIAFLLSR